MPAGVPPEQGILAACHVRRPRLTGCAAGGPYRGPAGRGYPRLALPASGPNSPRIGKSPIFAR